MMIEQKLNDQLQLRLFNSLQQKVEVFSPQFKHEVSMYVCGPTVYDHLHIGNGRPLVVFDLLYRLLKLLYPEREIKYVRNITDIDDKIIKWAKLSGDSVFQYTQKYIKHFRECQSKLELLPCFAEPQAIDYIPAMVKMISDLIDKGHAYVNEGHVLFSVQSYKQYGKLSRRTREQQVAGARVEVAPYKHDPADFVLWKPSQDDAPAWPSPWGDGRPGWHLECSAMVKDTLGDTIDIHGGGLDLLFPHHENECAQSCCATGKQQLAHYWVHNGFVTMEGDKMAKSEGNVVRLYDLLERFPSEVVRLSLLSAHYHHPLKWSDDLLLSTYTTLDRMYTLLDIDEHLITQADAAQPDLAFVDALCDNMNTPKAIVRLHELLTALSGGLDKTKVEDRAKIIASGRLLGILTQTTKAWREFTSATTAAGIPAEQIKDLLEQRMAARSAREFARADQIRVQLQDAGVIIEDLPNGQSNWRRKV